MGCPKEGRLDVSELCLLIRDRTEYSVADREEDPYLADCIRRDLFGVQQVRF